MIGREDAADYCADVAEYWKRVTTIPLLSPEREQELAKAWRDNGDRAAADALVNSHLLLVVSMATQFAGYGLPADDIISQGNLGLMKAVEKFDPERGFRLSTYAMCWIRAMILEYVLGNYSLVKMGTTAAQKKLFFNLRRLKGELEAFEEGDLSPDDVARIANDLGVSDEDVVSMNRRISGDTSLNVGLGEDSDDELVDLLPGAMPSAQSVVEEMRDGGVHRELIAGAMGGLNDREKHILAERHLSEDPVTLDELAQTYGISRERVRQIETRALKKLETALFERVGLGDC